MANITLRSTKGSPLTSTELDNNFSNINIELASKLSSDPTAFKNYMLTVGGAGSNINADTVRGLVNSAILPSATDKSSVVTRDSSGNFTGNAISAANVVTTNASVSTQLALAGGTGGTAKLDIGGSGASLLQASFTSGIDGNFKLVVRNGNATTNAAATEVARIALEYAGASNSGINFYRGGSAYDGSITLTTNGSEKVWLSSNGDLGIGVNPGGGYKFQVTTITNQNGSLFTGNSGYPQIVATDGNVVMYSGYTAGSGTGGISYSGTASSHPLAIITGNAERARFDTAGNFSLGTLTGVGKLNVQLSSSGNGNTSAWDNTYALIGTTNSVNGAALALGFNTSVGASLTALAPAVGWYPMTYQASQHNFNANGINYLTLNSSSINTTLSINSSGGGAGQFMAAYGSGSTFYNAMLRNDGSDVYLLSSAVSTTLAGAIGLGWNGYRPFSWNLASGNVSINASAQNTTIGGPLFMGAGLTQNTSTQPVHASNTCKAWVSFTGQTGAIRASYNVSSVTRTAVGKWTVNFTNAMVDANACAVCSGQITGLANYMYTGTLALDGTITASTVGVAYMGADPNNLVGNGASGVDITYCTVAVFR